MPQKNTSSALAKLKKDLTKAKSQIKMMKQQMKNEQNSAFVKGYMEAEKMSLKKEKMMMSVGQKFQKDQAKKMKLTKKRASSKPTRRKTMSAKKGTKSATAKRRGRPPMSMKRRGRPPKAASMTTMSMSEGA